jgi:alpha-L-rhamnosidase
MKRGDIDGPIRPVRSLRMKTVPWIAAAMAALAPAARAQLAPVDLQVEMRVAPEGLDDPRPRLSWRLESAARAQVQSAYRILAAAGEAALAADTGDLWDTGKVEAGESMHVPYAGRPLASRQRVHWKVKVWDGAGRESAWSAPARWSMGLLRPEDWTAQWIAFKDDSPVHADRKTLHLPPARHYRKEFAAGKPVKRATVHASALGIYELEINGRRVGDAWFTPGWADYAKRGYYNTADVTALVAPGPNCLGAAVADGWYAGYLGYALLCGYGPHKAGRALYGKTPALLAQLEIEYADGTTATVGTDATWKVTGAGPIREADFLMGESYDARREMPGWSRPGFDAKGWEDAVPAAANGSVTAPFSDPSGTRPVELGFRKPPRLQAYVAPPIRVTQEVPAQRVTGAKPGVYIFDLGQNIAGVVRLKVKGPAGTALTIRHGEMLHPDGRLMTENLRKARATDTYILRGDPAGETWSPRFTYHGFQFVEIAGLPGNPGLDAVTGLVLHNDTPLVGAFECSDDLLNRLHRNIVWTQRGNYVEVPTDCPQRDERLGWMGDAQIYARAATFNADVAAFFTKWLDDVEEAQHPFGAYPDYCPYPMAHGQPGKPYGTAWMDAGVICPWTVWTAYGDTRAVERHYDSMRRFLDFRAEAGPTGKSIGNPWGDWLNVKEDTPIQYVDLCYHARSADLMAAMASAIGRADDAAAYRKRFDSLKEDFKAKCLEADGRLKVDTQTAHVLALDFGLLPDALRKPAADRLAAKIAKNGHRMTTGFLGTKPLLPVLSANGHHDLAVRLFQSRQFPSWGFEVVNGATTIWERWDSYTKEEGFGRHNAAMNSFSHYAFGAVCEWMFRDLAGIDTDGPGYRKILIRPGPPSPGSNPDVKPIDRVKASYGSRRGPIAVEWSREAKRFVLRVEIPANTTATVLLPAADAATITEGGKPLAEAAGVRLLRMEGGRAVLEIGSGRYAFSSTLP